MALVISNTYPGQSTAPSAEYPQGSTRNVSVSGDGTGTPADFRWVNDILGFLQSMIATAGITPSGNPDTVLVSQYMESLDYIVAPENVPYESHTVGARLGETVTVKDTGAIPGPSQTTAFAVAEATGKNVLVSGGLYTVNDAWYQSVAKFTQNAFMSDFTISEHFRPSTQNGKLINMRNAFEEMIARKSTANAPYITCYGDQNTRYYESDEVVNEGPISKSYGAQLDVMCAQYQSLYGATIDIQADVFTGSATAAANFLATVSSSSDFVILNWGTVDVAAATSSLTITDFLDNMLTMFVFALDYKALPIVVGIPYFGTTYGTDGVTSTERLRLYNASLHALCIECGVPFIDAYNLTAPLPTRYFNNTSQSDLNSEGQKRVAQKALEIIREFMASSATEDKAGYYRETWGDYTNVAGTNEISPVALLSREVVDNGGKQFEVLKIEQGASITFRGSGRFCAAFYPSESAIAFIQGNGGSLFSISHTITLSIDDLEPYSVSRADTTYTTTRDEEYEVKILANTGDLYLRSIAFEDQSTEVSVTNSSFIVLAGSALPSTGVVGRAYFITDLARAVWWYAGDYVGAEGWQAVGTTIERDALGAFISEGYRFYSTNAAAGFFWDGATWTPI